MVNHLHFFEIFPSYTENISIEKSSVSQWCTEDAVFTQAVGSCCQRFVITSPHSNICSVVSALPLRNNLRQSMLEPDNFSDNDARCKDDVNTDWLCFLMILKQVLFIQTCTEKRRQLLIPRHNKTGKSNPSYLKRILPGNMEQTHKKWMDFCI